jgi:type II secretory pathway pseudopilin PulG
VSSRRRRQAGFTVLEVVFAMAMLLVVSLAGFTAVGSVLRVGSQALNSRQAGAVAAVTMTNLRQEAVSANILFNPASEGANAGTNPGGTSIPAGFSLRIYTQTNGIFTCVQWRLLDTGALQLRSWSDLWQSNGVVRGWTTLLTGIANPTSEPPFVLDSGANYGGTVSGRLLDVDLVVRGGGGSANRVEVRASIAGRDAEYYPQNTGDCSPVPTP